MGSQADGWRGIPLCRFGENLAPRNFRQLPHDFVAQQRAGEHPQPFGGNQGGKPLDGGLNQRALIKNREHLFGVPPPAAWPESRPAAACQNQAVIIRHGYWMGYP